MSYEKERQERKIIQRIKHKEKKRRKAWTEYEQTYKYKCLQHTHPDFSDRLRRLQISYNAVLLWLRQVGVPSRVL